MSANEEWRPVKDFEGLYEVSNQGNIRHVINGPKKLTPNSIGCLKVMLYKRNKSYCKYVNRLVCEAFHGTPFKGALACHRRGRAQGNSADNLYWGTYDQNTEDQVRLKERKTGEQHHAAKLTWDQVRRMREKAKQGSRISYLSKEFNVAWRQCKSIINGDSWKEEA